jgi:hypothetical protein
MHLAFTRWTYKRFFTPRMKRSCAPCFCAVCPVPGWTTRLITPRDARAQTSASRELEEPTSRVFALMARQSPNALCSLLATTIMALLDPATVLKQLGDLPPSENPYTFLNDLVQSFLGQPANVGVTVALCICSVAWIVSLVCSTMALRSKFKRGDRFLYRKQQTAWGTFRMFVSRRHIAYSDVHKASRHDFMARAVHSGRLNLSSLHRHCKFSPEGRPN